MAETLTELDGEMDAWIADSEREDLIELIAEQTGNEPSWAWSPVDGRWLSDEARQRLLQLLTLA